MDQPLIAGVHERLTREGLVLVRFNFPYAEEGKKHPDPEPVLEGAFRLVVEYITEMEEFKGLELFLGGKSMGARLAARRGRRTSGPAAWFSWATPCTHRANPRQLRDRPLYGLPCPPLFIQGGRRPPSAT